MATTNYLTARHMTVHENRGGAERDYLVDRLGSTVALLDNAQSQTDTFSYWPYGETRSRSGSTATPFMYVGAYGYFTDASGLAYVRARHLSTGIGAWISRDPIWPRAKAYSYALGAPSRLIDPLGLQASPQCGYGDDISMNCFWQNLQREFCDEFPSMCQQPSFPPDPVIPQTPPPPPPVLTRGPYRPPYPPPLLPPRGQCWIAPAPTYSDCVDYGGQYALASGKDSDFLDKCQDCCGAHFVAGMPFTSGPSAGHCYDACSDANDALAVNPGYFWNAFVGSIRLLGPVDAPNPRGQATYGSYPTLVLPRLPAPAE